MILTAWKEAQEAKVAVKIWVEIEKHLINIII